MPEPTYFTEGNTPRRRDTDKRIGQKLVGIQADSAPDGKVLPRRMDTARADLENFLTDRQLTGGGLAANNPKRSDTRLMLAQKVLAFQNGVAV